jgi:hypothetical protein
MALCQDILMASILMSLQRSIYQALSNDPALVLLLGGAHIYDGVPRDAALPYVTIDEIVTRDRSADDCPEFEHAVTLSVWSQYAGKQEVYAVLDAVRNCLHAVELKLEDATLISLRFESSSAGGDGGDCETCHGSIRFRAVTEVNEELEP